MVDPDETGVSVAVPDVEPDVVPKFVSVVPDVDPDVLPVVDPDVLPVVDPDVLTLVDPEVLPVEVEVLVPAGAVHFPDPEHKLIS